MAHVLSENVRAGMILARAVVDARGHLLIPGGDELTERHLKALRQWGIPTVEVEGDIDDPAPEIDPAVLLMAEVEVHRRFVIAGDSCAFLEALQEQAVIRSARRMAPSPARVAP